MATSGNIGIQVDGVFRDGRTTAHRSSHASTHAHGLAETLVAAHGTVGHPEVMAALRELNTGIADPAVKLPGMVSAAGTQVSNTASVTRDSDNGAAQVVRARTDVTETSATGLMRLINVDPH